MKRLFFWTLLAVCLTSTCSLQAQKKTPAKTVSATSKIKPPKLKTTLGIFSDSVSIPADQARAIIGSSLKVTDDKNNVLTVTYYQFMYKRKAVTEDETTGKITPTMSPVADYFTSTPLPLKWSNIIRESLVPGEELYFFDVIARDAEGHLFYAPNLKIITQ